MSPLALVTLLRGQGLEKVMLIRPAKLYHERVSPIELLEMTRASWRVSERREQADFAFTVIDGHVVEVYRIDRWLPAGTLPYETRLHHEVLIDGRWEFDGEVDRSGVRERYLGASVKAYLPRGLANPVVYVNC